MNPVSFLLHALLTLTILPSKGHLPPPASDTAGVAIGNQVWMTKNLDVETFRNGEAIPQVQTVAEWREAAKLGRPAWCHYENDPANGIKYGKLYNWHAVNDPRGLAPAGWHVPSSSEWMELAGFLGGAKGFVGIKLKSKSGWEKNGNGMNTSGFSALPGGVRDTDVLIVGNFGFGGEGSLGTWWSSSSPSRSEDGIYCFVLDKKHHYSYCFSHPSEGLAVRLVKDL